MSSENASPTPGNGTLPPGVQNLISETGKLRSRTPSLMSETENVTSGNTFFSSGVQKGSSENASLMSGNEILPSSSENLSSGSPFLSSGNAKMSSSFEKLSRFRWFLRRISSLLNREKRFEPIVTLLLTSFDPFTGRSTCPHCEGEIFAFNPNATFGPPIAPIYADSVMLCFISEPHNSIFRHRTCHPRNLRKSAKSADNYRGVRVQRRPPLRKPQRLPLLPNHRHRRHDQLLPLLQKKRRLPRAPTPRTTTCAVLLWRELRFHRRRTTNESTHRGPRPHPV